VGGTDQGTRYPYGPKLPNTVSVNMTVKCIEMKESQEPQDTKSQP
jgi:hypothetical protein